VAKGLTKDAILARLDNQLQIPGVTNIWTQPIRNRIDMLSTGIRTQIGIKVFGPDLRGIEQLSEQIKQVVQQVPGATDLYAERITGAPYMEMTVDRPAADRYGLNVADVQDVIETAIGGKNLTTTIEGRQRFPVRVRYARDFRENPQQLGDVLVTGSNGAQVPLSEVVKISTTMGPSMISSENGLLRGSVLLNVRGRDVGGFVDQAQRAVRQQVRMPPGYFIEWSGQYQNQISARKRLELVIPIVLLVIFVLLYRTYGSVREAAHVLLAVPFALTGGVFLVKLLHLNFSVAVWVGFIALFGTAVQTGVVMVIYLEEAVARRTAADGTLTLAGLHQAVMEGALLRLRPKVMTVATVVAGLLPCCGRHAPGGVHATACRPCAWRHGQLAPSRPHRHPGHLSLAARARPATSASPVRVRYDSVCPAAHRLFGTCRHSRTPTAAGARSRSGSTTRTCKSTISGPATGIAFCIGLRWPKRAR